MLMEELFHIVGGFVEFSAKPLAESYVEKRSNILTYNSYYNNVYCCQTQT